MKRSSATFQVGDSVMVKAGIKDPDNESVEIGGWQGRIAEIDGEDEATRSFLVQWDGPTLRGMPQNFIEENVEEGLDWSTMYLGEEELVPVAPRDTEEEADAALMEVVEKFLERVVPPGAKEALVEYTRIREQFKAVNSAALKCLTREEMAKAAKQLGILKGDDVFELDSESEMDVLADFALYELHRAGVPVIQCFLQDNPVSRQNAGIVPTIARALGSLVRKEAVPALDDAAITESVSQSFTSLFQVDQVSLEGLKLADLLNPKRPPCRLLDIGFMSTAAPGILIFTRLLPVQDFHITGGAAFCFPAHRKQHLVVSYWNAIKGRRGHRREVERYRFFHRANRRMGLEMWYN